MELIFAFSVMINLVQSSQESLQVNPWGKFLMEDRGGPGPNAGSSGCLFLFFFNFIRLSKAHSQKINLVISPSTEVEYLLKVLLV